MAKQFPGFEPPHLKLIADSPLFFVATAAETGRVNLSPKGGDAVRVLGPNRLIWRNLTGSGNESAGHVARVNRMTLMWCSFTRRPVILRAYGSATVVHETDPDWAELDGAFPPHAGARQVFDVAVDLVQTSCGYAVPLMEQVSQRDTLDLWAEDRGREGVRAYWAEKNTQTLDGFPTGIPT